MANKPTEQKELKPTAPAEVKPEVTQEVDPVAAKLAELDEEIRKAREANARMEVKEKEMDEKMSKLKSFGQLPDSERANVVAAHKSKAARMKEALEKQEKVPVFVPLDGKEKKGTQLPVTLNGYRVNVPKGLYVKVPQQVAQVIMDSLNQTQEATDIPQNLDNMDEARKAALN